MKEVFMFFVCKESDNLFKTFHSSFLFNILVWECVTALHAVFQGRKTKGCHIQFQFKILALWDLVYNYNLCLAQAGDLASV